MYLLEELILNYDKISFNKKQKLIKCVNMVIDDFCTPKQKQAFFLRQQGKTLDEIGEEMGGITKGVVSRHILKAIKIIERHLQYILPLLED